MKGFLSQNLLAEIKMPHAKPQRRKGFILFQGKTLKNKNPGHLLIIAAFLILAVAAGTGRAQAAASQPPCSGPSCPLTTAAGPQGDIRDIRGPIHMPNPLNWIWGVAGGMLLLFLAWTCWKWFRKRGAKRAKRAFETAFEALEKAKSLMTPEQAEAYSVAVSGIIRTYIEKRFSVKATRHTTREFMMVVASKSTGELSHHHDRLQAFMANCDLAKFARHQLSREQMEKMHESAWQFVKETKPREEGKSTRKSAEPLNHAAPEMDAVLRTSSAPKSASWRKWNKKFSGLRKDEDPSMGLSHTHQPAAAGGR